MTGGNSARSRIGSCECATTYIASVNLRCNLITGPVIGGVRPSLHIQSVSLILCFTLY